MNITLTIKSQQKKKEGQTKIFPDSYDSLGFNQKKNNENSFESIDLNLGDCSVALYLNRFELKKQLFSPNSVDIYISGFPTSNSTNKDDQRDKFIREFQTWIKGATVEAKSSKGEVIFTHYHIFSVKLKIHETNPGFELHCTAYSPDKYLTYGTGTRDFVDMSISEIATQIIQNPKELSPIYRFQHLSEKNNAKTFYLKDMIHPCLIQSKESIYSFLSRICYEFGEYFYYEDTCLHFGSGHYTDGIDGGDLLKKKPPVIFKDYSGVFKEQEYDLYSKTVENIVSYDCKIAYNNDPVITGGESVEDSKVKTEVKAKKTTDLTTYLTFELKNLWLNRICKWLGSYRVISTLSSAAKDLGISWIALHAQNVLSGAGSDFEKRNQHKEDVYKQIVNCNKTNYSDDYKKIDKKEEINDVKYLAPKAGKDLQNRAKVGNSETAKNLRTLTAENYHHILLGGNFIYGQKYNENGTFGIYCANSIQFTYDGKGFYMTVQAVQRAEVDLAPSDGSFAILSVRPWDQHEFPGLCPVNLRPFEETLQAGGNNPMVYRSIRMATVEAASNANGQKQVPNDVEKKLANTDPYELGRVRVVFDDDDTRTVSQLMPVATPASTKGTGFFFTPRVGDRVLVAYAYGNPNKPFVLCSLTQGSIKDNEFKSQNPAGDYYSERSIISSPNGHKIRFDDPMRGGVANNLISTLCPAPLIGQAFTNMDFGSNGNKLNNAMSDIGWKNGGITMTDNIGTYSIKMDAGNRSVAISSPIGEVTVNALTGIKINAPKGDIDINGYNINLTAGNNVNIQSGKAINSGWTISGVKDELIGLVANFASAFLNFDSWRFAVRMIFQPVEGTISINSSRNVFISSESDLLSATNILKDPTETDKPNRESISDRVLVIIYKVYYAYKLLGEAQKSVKEKHAAVAQIIRKFTDTAKIQVDDNDKALYKSNEGFLDINHQNELKGFYNIDGSVDKRDGSIYGYFKKIADAQNSEAFNDLMPEGDDVRTQANKEKLQKAAISALNSIGEQHLNLVDEKKIITVDGLKQKLQLLLGKRVDDENLQEIVNVFIAQGLYLSDESILKPKTTGGYQEIQVADTYQEWLNTEANFKTIFNQFDSLASENIDPGTANELKNLPVGDLAERKTKIKAYTDALLGEGWSDIRKTFDKILTGSFFDIAINEDFNKKNDWRRNQGFVGVPGKKNKLTPKIYFATKNNSFYLDDFGQIVVDENNIKSIKNKINSFTDGLGNG